MEFTASELWSRVLESAREGMPEQSYRTWLAGSVAVGLSENELIVEAPSDFHVEWVEDKYGELLSDLVQKFLGRSLDLTIRCSSGAPPASVPPVEVSAPPDPLPSPPAAREPEPTAHVKRSSSLGTLAHRDRAANLNERYTFDRFVVGNNNQLASAASRAVAEQPARIYNPLFLYGGVGLGKTHLMHAVGNVILERQSEVEVAYVTTEQFMNELVNAIQQGTTPQFRRRFRHIDLLLVDDIHFLQRKESTQEEFFHTFNALYDAGKQIILTSDRPPKELPGVEDRLVSRFEWGLVADIKPPDYETRIAILQKKANDDGLVIEPDILDFIARACTASVRELEGAVIKLLAYSSLQNRDITLELARTVLQSVIRGDGEPGAPPTPEQIRDEVARAWRVRPDGLSSKKRTKDLTVPRQVAMYLIKEIVGASLIEVGRVFGGRDHSTVIHSIRRVEAKMADDPEFAARVQALAGKLEGRA